MLGLSNFAGINLEPHRLEDMVDTIFASFKGSGIYDLLTVEMLFDILNDLKSMCNEVETKGFVSFAEKYGVPINDDIRNNVSEATEGFVKMYRTLITLYERIYAEKLHESNQDNKGIYRDHKK